MAQTERIRIGFLVSSRSGGASWGGDVGGEPAAMEENLRTPDRGSEVIAIGRVEQLGFHDSIFIRKVTLYVYRAYMRRDGDKDVER